MASLLCPPTHILQFGQILIQIRTNTKCNLGKCNLQFGQNTIGDYEETNGRPALSAKHTACSCTFGQMQNAIWENTICNLVKIHLVITRKLMLAC